MMKRRHLALRPHPLHNLSETQRREIAFAICERIAQGRTLRDICAESGQPCVKTFCNWRNADPEIHAAYVAAWEARSEAIAFDIIKVADEETPKMVDASGNERIDPAAVAKQRLRAEARRWAGLNLTILRCPEPPAPPAPPPASNFRGSETLVETVRRVSPLLAGFRAHLANSSAPVPVIDAREAEVMPPLNPKP
jgi:hypothetical protein